MVDKRKNIFTQAPSETNCMKAKSLSGLKTGFDIYTDNNNIQTRKSRIKCLTLHQLDWMGFLQLQWCEIQTGK